MKKVFLSILAVAALASCVEDLGYDNPISFGAPFVGNTTKAAEDPSYGDPTKDAVALTKFNVYGTVQGTGAGVVNIFDGVEVNGTVGGEWGYETKYNQYWIPGAKYNFAAVVDAETVELGTVNKLPATLTPAKNGAYYKDMLYDKAAEIESATADQGKVNFAFEHLLAKAQFVVTSNTEGGYYYNVKNIKIQNIHTGAVYTVGTTGADGKDSGTWAGTLSPSANDWFSLGNILNITKANAEGGTSGKFMTNETQVLLIPTTDEFQVEFVVELWNDNGAADDVLLREIHYTTTAPTNGAEHEAPIKVNTDLVKGYAYNFNLNLTAGSLIQFTVTSNPTWASGDVNLGLE